MKKRWIAWLLSVAMLLSMVVVPAGAAKVQLDQVFYVVGTYAVESANSYGVIDVTTYAQAIDMEGKESQIIVDIASLTDAEFPERSASDLDALWGGLSNAQAGFYTFEKASGKAGRSGVMVATEIDHAYNDDKDNLFFGVLQAQDLTSKTTKIAVGDGYALVTDDTKFIVIEDNIGTELNTSVTTGSITRTLDRNAPMVLGFDANGNMVVEAVVIITDDVRAIGEDYVYISQAQLQGIAATAEGYECAAYFTGTGEEQTIRVDWRPNYAGFYQYVYDAAENKYDLAQVGENVSGSLYQGERVENILGGKLLVTEYVEALDASQATIVDTRSQRELDNSDLAKVESLADLAALAKRSECEIKISVVVDEDVVTNIFVLQIVDPSDGGGIGAVTAPEGSGVLPVGPGRPETIMQVLDIAEGQSITLERLGTLDNAPGNDVVDEYLGIAVGDWVVAEQQDGRYVLDSAQLKVMSGVVVCNQSCGESFTTVVQSGQWNTGCFDVETGLDMLGRYVTVYYKEEYATEEMPGLTYGIEDKGTTIYVSEPLDTVAKYRAVFRQNYAVAQDLLVFSGNNEVVAEDVIPDYVPGMYAPAGTYVIADGEIVSYRVPVYIYADQVESINTRVGNESITLVGARKINNNRSEDRIVEYEGIAEGDYVTYVKIGTGSSAIYNLTKAASVEGKISRAFTNEDGKTCIVVNGTTYVQKNFHSNDTGLKTEVSWINWNKNYRVYLTAEGEWIGIEGVKRVATLSDFYYVMGTYAVDSTNSYGIVDVTTYAQAIDMEGKESQIIVDIASLTDAEFPERSASDLDALWGGLSNAQAGFYTFEKASGKAGRSGVMVATEIDQAANEDQDNIFEGTLPAMDLNSKVTEVEVGDDYAFLTANTKFIVIEDNIGAALETAVTTGTITKTLFADAPMILSVDEDGNMIVEVVVIVTPDMNVSSEDIIYISADQVANAARIGTDKVEYSVYMVSDGTVKPGFVAEAVYYPGFFLYDYDAADGVYILTEADYVPVDTYVGMIGNKIRMAHKADGYTVAEGAYIVDTRTAEEIKTSESCSYAIESLTELKVAARDNLVAFYYFLNDDEEVESIYIRSVILLEEGGAGGDGAVTPPTPPIVPPAGTGKLPAASKRPENITYVTRVGVENITLEGIGTIDRAQISGAADVKKGDLVLVERQGEQYVISKEEICVVEGIIVGNQACGYSYTEVRVGDFTLAFDVETDLDMLGRCVRVYYQEEFISEEEPGLTYGIEDIGTTIHVSEPIEYRGMYEAVFGSAKEYWVSESAITLDGNFVHTSQMIPYMYESYFVGAGTYVLYEGTIISYVAPTLVYADKVESINSRVGNESITLVGARKIDNNRSEDRIVEYEGIAEGDYVTYVKIGTGSSAIYNLTKATCVEGQITRISTNEDGSPRIEVNGTTYVRKNFAGDDTGLSTDVYAIDWEEPYTVYLTADGKWIGFRPVKVGTPVSDAYYVVGTYAVDSTNSYGIIDVTTYAQAVDMEGKESQIIIDIASLTEADFAERAESDLEAVLSGTSTAQAGFYTFKEASGKAGQSGVMVATRMNQAPDEDRPCLYVDWIAANTQLNDKSMVVRTIEGEYALLEADSRFVLVGGHVGAELETAMVRGGVDKLNLADETPVLVEMNEEGDIALRAMVVFADPDVLRTDVVYVAADQCSSTGKNTNSYSYEVFDAAAGTLREVKLDRDNAFGQSGFYRLEDEDGDGVYTAQAYAGTWVKTNQEILDWQDGAVTTTDLVNYPADKAAVVDLRKTDRTITDMAGLAALDDQGYANCRVTVDVWVDCTSGKVGTFFITDAQPRINGLSSYAYVYGTRVNEGELEAWSVRASAQKNAVLSVNDDVSGLKTGLYEVQDKTGALNAVPGAYHAQTAPYYVQNTLAQAGFVLDDSVETLPLADGTVAAIADETVFVTITGTRCEDACVTVGTEVEYTFVERQAQVLLTHNEAGQPVACVVYLNDLDNIMSGICGNGLAWQIDAAGTMTIGGGDGVIPTYSLPEQAPWYSVRQDIKTVKFNGITAVGDNAFSGCSVLARAEFAGNALAHMGSQAFDGAAEDFALYCETGTEGWTGTGYDPETVTWCGWPLRMTSNYVLRHLGQKADADGYEVLWEETYTALSGTAVEVSEADYQGFVCNEAASVLSGLVDARGTLVLERCFDRLSYTLSFHTEGDPVVADITALYGAQIELPEPRRYGVRFEGWYSDAQLTVPVEQSTMPLNGGVLYPKWGSLDTDRGVEHIIDQILFRDEDTKRELDAMPEKNVLVEVQVTNLGSKQLDTILLVSYTEDDQMLDLHYMYAASSQGQQTTFGAALDNTDGRIGKVKAFVLTYLGGAPLAKSLERPAK